MSHPASVRRLRSQRPRVGSLVEPPSQRDNDHASHDNDSQQQDKPSSNNTSGNDAAADATAQQAIIVSLHKPPIGLHYTAVRARVLVTETAISKYR